MTAEACPLCTGEVVEGLVLTYRGNSPPGNYRAVFCRQCGYVLGPAGAIDKLVWEDEEPRRSA